MARIRHIAIYAEKCSTFATTFPFFGVHGGRFFGRSQPNKRLRSAASYGGAAYGYFGVLLYSARSPPHEVATYNPRSSATQHSPASCRNKTT